MHRRFEKILTTPGIHAKFSRNWMQRELLLPQVEAALYAIRDQAVPTLDIIKRVWRQKLTSTACRFCHSKPETLDHVLTGCGALSWTDHLQRHNDVAKRIYFAICKATGTRFRREWWTRRPPSTLPLVGGGHIHWDRKIAVFHSVDATWPDIVLQLPDRRRLLIEVTVCSDRKDREVPPSQPSFGFGRTGSSSSGSGICHRSDWCSCRRCLT